MTTVWLLLWDLERLLLWQNALVLVTKREEASHLISELYCQSAAHAVFSVRIPASDLKTSTVSKLTRILMVAARGSVHPDWPSSEVIDLTVASSSFSDENRDTGIVWALDLMTKYISRTHVLIKKPTLSLFEVLLHNETHHYMVGCESEALIIAAGVTVVVPVADNSNQVGTLYCRKLWLEQDRHIWCHFKSMK